MTKQNVLRKLLDQNLPSVATRLWSTWPFYTEAVGSTGKYDYIEFLAEYAPFSQVDLENIARAAELSNMGSMIKVDFQNRGYVAQKAIGSGFQAVLFTDCQTAEDVRESVWLVKPETPEDGGRFGYPNKRYIGFQPRISQLDHVKRQREIVLAFMIEKKCAVDNIEEICSVPGVDMVQFGPSDYCMSRGWNAKDHTDEYKAAERRMIEVALKHHIHPRCEIQSVEAAKYYMDLGVKHFCIGDQLVYLLNQWTSAGNELREMIAGK
ncbi:MAG: HpcH/HpaI aldolase/citrate lyase family protein [Negativicutes bacterium]